jgi:hypothetical protein
MERRGIETERGGLRRGSRLVASSTDSTGTLDRQHIGATLEMEGNLAVLLGMTGVPGQKGLHSRLAAKPRRTCAGKCGIHSSLSSRRFSTGNASSLWRAYMRAELLIRSPRLKDGTTQGTDHGVGERAPMPMVNRQARQEPGASRRYEAAARRDNGRTAASALAIRSPVGRLLPRPESRADRLYAALAVLSQARHHSLDPSAAGDALAGTAVGKDGRVLHFKASDDSLVQLLGVEGMVAFRATRHSRRARRVPAAER